MAPLHPGDLRILADAGEIDDRGLEYAEDLLHEARHFNDMHGYVDPRVKQALAAVDGVRKLTKRGS
ncbi:MAG TPA: hypothetical protein VMD48_07925 [Solirubrobacteraceae bacterium]|nr:hypothetical protein [Solirubrobacteraceae bacterium]